MVNRRVSVGADSDRDYREVGPGFYLQAPAYYELPDTPTQGRALRYHVKPDGAGIRVAGIELRSTDGTRITATEWRAANPSEWWEVVVIGAAKRREVLDGGGTRYVGIRGLDVATAAKLRARGPSNSETLQAVADSYNVAVAVGIPPSKYVQQVFSAEGQLDPLPKTTAGKWIRRAKDQGLIKEDPHAGK